MHDLLTNNHKYKTLHTIAWKIIDAVYPPFCCNCGVIGFDLCPSCLQDITRIPENSVCSFCGNPLDMHLSCKHKENHSKFSFTQARSWGVYSGPLKIVLRRIKYERGFGLIKFLSAPIAEYIRRWNIDIDMIVPVPLGTKRQYYRGYNQSELISRPVSQLLGTPFLPKAIRRERETRSQVGLNLDQRKNNVDGAFTADSILCEGKAILLFDDITTTFSTLNACVTALKTAGAKNVFCFTVARTIFQQEKEKK